MKENRNSNTVNEGLRKLPIDVKIVSWILIVIGMIGLLFVVLTIIGIARKPIGYSRLAALGFLRLDTDLSYGFYNFFFSILHIIAGLSIKKLYKFSWWLTLIVLLYAVSDSILIYHDHPPFFTFDIALSTAIIIWLFWRRKLFGIAIKREFTNTS